LSWPDQVFVDINLSIADMKYDIEIEDSPGRCASAVTPAGSDVQAAVASLRLATATMAGADNSASIGTAQRKHPE
jgi:hypothetical protein